jgi:hypothetical protein
MYVAEDASTHKTRVKALLDDLFSSEPLVEDALSRRAHMLDCDLARPHELF